MNIISFLNCLKFKIIRLVESNPSLNLLIYNNISLFKILLPHEKDYYGIKLLLKSRINDSIIDVGGNLGISSMGFRKLGLVNKIYIFEPNRFIFDNYIKTKLVKKYKNIYGFNYALGNKDELKNFYYPYYNNKCIHYFCSFDKKYIQNSIDITFKKKIINIIDEPIKIKIFDNLKLKSKPKFIKIDVEGFDLEVIKGMKDTIQKFNPILLVEFNKNNFFKIKKLLNNYNAWVYYYEKNKFKIFEKKMIDKDIARTTNSNLMSVRNIFFIPKLHRWF
jgi:FkbM family methyltransferase